MNRHTLIPAIALLVASSSIHAHAQNITVQQPAFSNFSVSTTVSAPDQGGAFIGGTGRAANGVTRQGLAPAGTAVGGEATGASMNLRVWIHDFEEMDRLILEDESLIRRSGSSLPLAARIAWQRLHGESISDLALKESVAKGERKPTQSAQSKIPPRPPLPGPEFDDDGVGANRPGKRAKFPVEETAQSNSSALINDLPKTNTRTVPAQSITRASTGTSTGDRGEADRLYEAGEAARIAGKRNLAVANYRLAALKGSKESVLQLERMGAPTKLEKTTNPVSREATPGSHQNERADRQPLGFDAKSNSKRSGSARK